MGRQDQRIIAAGDDGRHSAGSGRRYWSFGLRWLVRLFLALFIALAIASWTDLFFSPVVSEHLIGSEHACAISYSYCSLLSYVLVDLLPSSLLGGAAVVALAWWRMPRRETVLNIVAILALAYLAWSVLEVQLAT
jgi:hypothetical protein